MARRRTPTPPISKHEEELERMMYADYREESSKDLAREGLGSW
ncbi:MAG: hypothetical protein ABSF83_10175 [Nitrososphaerales archaeon]|jgi:hypothetical protein